MFFALTGYLHSLLILPNVACQPCFDASGQIWPHVEIVFIKKNILWYIHIELLKFNYKWCDKIHYNEDIGLSIFALKGSASFKLYKVLLLL